MDYLHGHEDKPLYNYYVVCSFSFSELTISHTGGQSCYSYLIQPTLLRGTSFCSTIEDGKGGISSSKYTERIWLERLQSIVQKGATLINIIYSGKCYISYAVHAFS